METTINKELHKILKGFDNRYFLDEELNKNKVIQDLEDYNPKLLQALLSNNTIKKYFTMNIEGHTILQTNKLIELFELNDYWKSSYTRYSKKIGLTTNGKFIDESTDVVLDFPYKDTVLKASMSKEDTDQNDLRPDEPFLNEVIAKEEIDQLLENKILVNVQKYNEYGHHDIVSFHENDSLIIKGNNLLGLHTLRNKYAGQVKLIYIDPPYNTLNDGFLYNDSFNHSTWLTFMKNRLTTARELMSDDGLICIQIDDKEQAYLKVLLDEIFGKSNFVNTLVVKMSESSGVKMSHVEKRLPKLKEYVHIYKKKDITLKPIKVKKSSDSDEMKDYLKYYTKIIVNKEVPVNEWVIQSLKDYFQENNLNYNEQNIIDFKLKNADRLVYRTNNNTLKKMQFSTETAEVISPTGIKYIWWEGKQMLFLKDHLEEILGDLWTDISTINLNKEGGSIDFENGKKPEKLIQRIIELTTDAGDIVLDFFLGSGTTAAVAHKMGRQYIGIEQMDYISTVTVPRLQKVIEGEQGGISKDVDWQGGGNFVYAELMEKNRGFIKMIQEAEDPLALQKIFDFMLEEAEIDFQVDLEEVKDTLHELSFEDQKKILFAIIDKNQLYYSYSEIDDENVRDLIADEDYTFNKSFYEDGGE